MSTEIISKIILFLAGVSVGFAINQYLRYRELRKDLKTELINKYKEVYGGLPSETYEIK